MRNILCTATALVGATLSSIALAVPRVDVITHRLCDPLIERVVERRPPFPPIPPVPPLVAIGCPIVDAKLGCAPDAQLTLRVQFDGPEGAQGRLNFTNASSQALERLVPSGSARRSKEDRHTFVLHPGVSVISGFTADANPAPLVQATLDVPSKWLGSFRKILPPMPPARVTVSFAQYVSAALVSEFTAVHLYVPCWVRASAEDQIKVTGNAPGRKAIALFDGMRGSDCVTDELGFGQDFVPVGKMIAPAGCTRPSRATIFSASNAVEYRRQIAPEWTASADVRPIALGNLLEQPVKIWILYDGCFDPEHPADPDSECANKCWNPVWASLPACHRSCLNPEHSSDPQCDTAPLRLIVPRLAIAQAKTVYREQFGGITFKETIVDLSQFHMIPSPALRNAVKDAREVAGCNSASDAEETVRSLMKVKELAEPPALTSRLDVFLVKQASAFGVWCGAHPAGKDVIVLDSAYRLRTLAHEFGHAFFNSGSQWNRHVVAGTDGSFPDNLMQAGATGQRLTIGQLFRATIDQDSAINRHGARLSGEKANCDEWTASDSCPKASCEIDRASDASLTGSSNCALSP